MLHASTNVSHNYNAGHGGHHTTELTNHLINNLSRYNQIFHHVEHTAAIALWLIITQAAKSF